MSFNQESTDAGMAVYDHVSLSGYAEHELGLAGYVGGDPNKEFMEEVGRRVISLVKIISEGISSDLPMRASIVFDLFSRLLRREPLTPLLGTEDEWEFISSGLNRNKRCPRVYKDSNGAFDTRGMVRISFPYEPDFEYLADTASLGGELAELPIEMIGWE